MSDLQEAYDKIEQLTRVVAGNTTVLKLNHEDIEQLTQKNDRLLTLLRHLFPEKSGEFFICGSGGERDAQGLPDYVMICPTYGADVGNMTFYHKEKK